MRQMRPFAVPCAGKCGLVKQLLKADRDLTFLCLCVWLLAPAVKYWNSMNKERPT
jgi:hypothetical protein